MSQPTDDLTIESCLKRIAQLDHLNGILAAEIDRMRPVVEAALTWYDLKPDDGPSVRATIEVQLREAVEKYLEE